ncbi:hypothetical protein AB3Y40_13995 [Yoonia sp. R2331]|uniref:hypothetical protein n=1 Tax=Yoonia sp. R2331 TaxID=3237238 RepID=UPI0034E43E2D
MTERTPEAKSVWDWTLVQQGFAVVLLIFALAVFPAGDAFGFLSVLLWLLFLTVVVFAVNYAYPFIVKTGAGASPFLSWRDASENAKRLNTLGRSGEGLPTERRDHDQN